jgi:hypothetical protein
MVFMAKFVRYLRILWFRLFVYIYTKTKGESILLSSEKILRSVSVLLTLLQILFQCVNVTLWP